MIRLEGIDHVGLRVESLDEAVPRWSIQFGLTERERRDGRAFLACDYEPYSIELLEGDVPGHDHTAYALAAGYSLAGARDELAALGIAVTDGERSLFVEDADGAPIELVESRPRDGARPAIARSTTTVPGFHPRRLGHVTVLSGAFEEQVRFYLDVLGMRPSDWLGDVGLWMHVGADHHVMAVMDVGYAHFHHLAFDVGDWGMMRVALDHLAQHGRWVAWGPLRHGLGQNLASYVRVPEERCFVELYCDMEQLRPGHEARTWPDDRFSSNTWGQLPPRSFFRFDAAAVESERESLEAQGVPLPPERDLP